LLSDERLNTTDEWLISGDEDTPIFDICKENQEKMKKNFIFSSKGP
jgi:hypothetical protein